MLGLSGEVVTLELRPAGRIVVRGVGGELRRAMIETVDAPQRLSFRWLPVPAGPGQGQSREPGTRVEFVLEEVAGGTELTVVETPWLAVGEILPMAGPLIVGSGPLAPPGAPPTIMALASPGAGRAGGR